MSKPDFYELLGVVKTASAADIKASYRKKAFEFHPDRNPGDHKAEEMFKHVAEAYDVLSDDRKRQIYDQFGHQGLAGGGGFGGHGFANADDIFSAFGDIFEDFFGGAGPGRRSGSRARRGGDMQVEVEVEFLEACFGIEREVSLWQNVACEPCKGSGAKAGSAPEVCKYCHGHGQVQMRQGFFTINTTCPQCGGRGQVIKDKCPDCRGVGTIKKERKLKVKVPAGIADSTRLLMQQQGEAGTNGGPNGDLYVYVHVKSHADFVREEDHIITELKVNFTDLALGTKVDVKTIEGDHPLEIEAGTQSGSILKLKHKGVANVRTGKRGDHLVHIQAITPEKLSAKQRELLEELNKEFGAPVQVSAKKKKKGIFG